MNEKQIWEALRVLDSLLSQFETHFTPEAEAYYQKLEEVNGHMNYFRVVGKRVEGHASHYLDPLGKEELEEKQLM